MTAATRRAAPLSGTPELLTVLGGGAIALGAWMPWMSYFAGLQPLRGIIGVNGRVLLAVGVVAAVAGAITAWKGKSAARRTSRRVTGIVGVVVAAASVWLLIGVRELTRVHASNAMLAPRPGVGLVIIFLGGCLCAAAAMR